MTGQGTGRRLASSEAVRIRHTAVASPSGDSQRPLPAIGNRADGGRFAAAGKARIMGGTVGLPGSGEAILGAIVGSGVAAGASTALGHSHAANVASSIIGGVVGRSAARAMQNRRNRPQGTTEEQTPLLGGDRSRNR